MNERVKKTLIGIVIGAAAIALLIFLGIFVRGITLAHSDKIFPNVYVADVNLGGMTEEEAKDAVEQWLEETHAERTLTVHLPDRDLVFEPENANTPLDLDAVVEAAMSYGKTEGVFAARKIYRQSKELPREIDLQEYLSLDLEYIKDEIQSVAEDVAQEMVQSEVTVDEEAEIITVHLGYNGMKLDAEKLLDQVLDAYATGDLSDIRFNYDVVPCDFVDMQEYYDRYCTPARSAFYDEETEKLVPEQDGYGFDLVAVNAQLALAEEGATVEIKLGPVSPGMTLNEFNEKNYPDVLSSFRSAHTANKDRTTNLRLACEAIDGTVLQPGQVFSFNNEVGERTPERGYKEGIIFADGGANELEAGGGICQIVSSVYMCALQADMQIVERQNHMYPVGYVTAGCDATVYWGAADFKFKNTNSTPLMIRAETANGYVTVQFVGTNEHDYTVKMTSQLVETIPYEEVETVDPTKPEGYRQQTQAPHTGYIYWSYKNYYDLNGKYLRTEKCAITEYAKYDAKYTVGPGGEKEEEKEKEKEPTPLEDIIDKKTPSTGSNNKPASGDKTSAGKTSGGSKNSGKKSTAKGKGSAGVTPNMPD